MNIIYPRPESCGGWRYMQNEYEIRSISGMDPDFLTSDAIYCRESYEKMKEPGSLFDLSGWLKTARRVHRLADEYNAQVWFGHDMTQFHELMQAEREYYD